MKRTCTIAELQEGWQIQETGRTYVYLAGALKADDRQAKKLAASGEPVITVRTIETTTLAGHLIAGVLTK